MVPSVQAILLDSFYGTERGFSVSSEARAEISELITQLEAKTLNPVATEAGRTFFVQSIQPLHYQHYLCIPHPIQADAAHDHLHVCNCSGSCTKTTDFTAAKGWPRCMSAVLT